MFAANTASLAASEATILVTCDRSKSEFPELQDAPINNSALKILAFLIVASGAGTAFTAEHATRPSGPSLLSNGKFAIASPGDQWPRDWPHPEGTSWETDGNAKFLRLQSSKPGQMVLVYRRVDLSSPLPPALEIRLRLRYIDVKPGEKSWFDARIMGHFKDRAGKILKPEPETPYFTGTSAGWIDRAYLVKVPAGATYFEIMPSLFQPARGTMDLAHCEVFSATPQQWADSQPQIVPSRTITWIGHDLPSPLHVAGNRLETAEGKAVWLQGLCVDSLEWSAAGERLATSIPVAIGRWKANVVRLPVRENFWFGRGPWQKPGDDGMAYRKIVDAVIADAAARGAYVALDLHCFGDPMDEHVAFWKDAATRYKNHPAVLFELFNEPHDISWKLWRDGGNLEDPKSRRNDENPAENKIPLTGETSPGMQGLLDAVRGTGATNLVIAGGLDWGYDLSGILDGYALKERAGGRGIMYSSHVYPWKTDWRRHTLAAAEKYPVFIGEVGCPKSYKDFSFIPPSGRHPLAGWSEDMLGLIQKYKLHWTAFSFHPTCGPNVISDWNYTPTPYWARWSRRRCQASSLNSRRCGRKGDRHNPGQRPKFSNQLPWPPKYKKTRHRVVIYFAYHRKLQRF